MRNQAIIITADRGIDGQGGIERMVAYINASWTPGALPLRVLTVRGNARHPWWLGRFTMAFGQLWWALQRRRVRVLHLSTAIKANVWRNYGLAMLARRYNVPVLWHMHGGGLDDWYQRQPEWAQRRMRAAWQAAAGIIVLGQHWQPFYQGLGVDSVMVLANAVPPAHQRSPRLVAGAPLRFLYLGVINHAKGAFCFVEALSRLDEQANWQATIAGHGDQAGCMALVQRHGLADRVQFTGWLDQHQVRQTLAQHHVLVLPSSRENQPLVILEAMQHGLAVVGTAVGCVPEMIMPGKTGLVLPEQSVDGLAAALQGICTKPDQVAQWQDNAYAQATQQHTLVQYIKKLREIYESVAAGRPSA